MAVVQNLLIGRARGRVGNVVFSTHKGQNIMKAKAEIVANPRTALQQANRAVFVLLLALGRLLRPLAVVGFKEYSGSMSWLNRFMHTNTNAQTYTWDGANSVWEYNPGSLVISEGSLQQNPFIISNQSVTGFDIEWDTTPVANQASNDLLSYLIVIGNSAPIMQRWNGGAPIERIAGTTNIAASMVSGTDIQVVCFFVSNDGRLVSNSYNASFTASF